MGRLGFFFQNKNRDAGTLNELEKISKISEFTVSGIFTHFLGSDEEGEKFEKIIKIQFENFEFITNYASKIFKNLEFVHCCNSGAIVNYSNTFCNMVRAGIILYGYYPSNFARKKIPLKNALEIKTIIAQVKNIPPGSVVSYGGTYVAEKNTKVATVSIGYADGLRRSLSNKGKMIINGQFVPIIGRICMDQCMLDVTEVVPAVKEGDIVTVLGKDGNLEITADDIAKLENTINYEVLCILVMLGQIFRQCNECQAKL